MRIAPSTNRLVLATALTTGFAVATVAQQQTPGGDCWVEMGPPYNPCYSIPMPPGACRREVEGPSGCYGCGTGPTGTENTYTAFVGCTAVFYTLNDENECDEELSFVPSGCEGCDATGPITSNCVGA